MSALTLNIKTDGKTALIVGGGRVALRKLRTIMAAGASVRVVSLHVCAEIEELSDAGAIVKRIGNYTTEDLTDIFLVVAATDNRQLNQQICDDARERGILVAVCDDSASGDCAFPALLQQGDLDIAVSTGGRCPSFALDVRDYIAGFIGPEFGATLQKLSIEREKLLTNGNSSTYNAQVLHSLAQDLLTELSESKDPVP